MTLIETGEVVQKWIDSSTNELHLSLCKDAVQMFIIERFARDPNVYALAVRLIEKIELRKIEITGHGLSQLD